MSTPIPIISKCESMLLSTLKITSSHVSFTNSGFIWRSQLIQLIHSIAKIDSLTPKYEYPLS